MAWVFAGVAISARYLLMNFAHCAGVWAESANFIVGRLGARLGNQMSYQFCDANLAFGTPRGGRRTVPMRRPSFLALGLPSRTMRIGILTFWRALNRSGRLADQSIRQGESSA